MDRLEKLKALLEEDKNDHFVWFAIAKEYEKRGDIDQALSTYEHLRSVNPEYTGVYYHLAQLYLDKREKKQAMNIYDLGIQKAKQQADFHALNELLNARQNAELDLE